MSDVVGPDWAAWSRKGFREIGRHREFTGETLRVLFMLLGHIERGNKIVVSHLQVADDLGIRPQRVLTQMRTLAAGGVLKKGRYYWFLDHRFGFRGDPDAELKMLPGGGFELREDE